MDAYMEILCDETKGKPKGTHIPQNRILDCESR